MTSYAGFAFMSWVFLAYWIYLVVILIHGKKKDREFLTFLYRKIGKAIAKTMFLKVERKQHTVYNENESYVVVSNHQTAMDIPANVAGSPNEVLFKFLGKKEAARMPFFGFIINRLCILVSRKSEQSRKASYQKMKDELKKGYSILIYAEGTRNRTDAPVKDFYNGAFRLAIEMQKPLVVNTLVGIKKLNPPTSFFSYLPGKVASHWEEPIITKGMTLEDVPKLKNQVKEIMINRLSKS